MFVNNHHFGLLSFLSLWDNGIIVIDRMNNLPSLAMFRCCCRHKDVSRKTILVLRVQPNDLNRMPLKRAYYLLLLLIQGLEFRIYGLRSVLLFSTKYYHYHFKLLVSIQCLIFSVLVQGNVAYCCKLIKIVNITISINPCCVWL